MDNFINSAPLVRILGLTSDHAKAFQDVNDVVYSSALDLELACALVEEQTILFALAVNAQELLAKFAQALFLAIVFTCVLSLAKLGVTVFKRRLRMGSFFQRWLVFLERFLSSFDTCRQLCEVDGSDCFRVFGVRESEIKELG